MTYENFEMDLDGNLKLSQNESDTLDNSQISIHDLKNLYSQENFKDVVLNARVLLEEDPSDEQIWNILGLGLLRLEDLDGAY